MVRGLMTRTRGGRTLGSVLAVGAILAALPAVAYAAETELGLPPPQFHENGHILTTSHVEGVFWGTVKLVSSAEGEIVCHNIMSGSVWNEGERGLGALEGWGTNACKAETLEHGLEGLFEKPIKEGKIKTPITVYASSELPLELEEREAEVCSAETKTYLEECKNTSERGVEHLPLRIRRQPASFPWNIRLIRQEREEEKVIVAELGVPPTGQSCYPKEVVEGKEVPAKWEKVPVGCVRIDIISPQIPDELMFYGSLKPRFVSGAGNGLDASHFEFDKEAGLLESNKLEAPETFTEGNLKVDGAEARELIWAK
jgi:hypothetical protein